MTGHKYFVFLLLFALCAATPVAAQSFDRFFHDKTMRFDFAHAGSAASENHYFERIKEEPHWGGSHVALIDEFQYGTQLFRLVDEATDSVIYSRGYCTLFNEWQTTQEAQLTSKSFPESVVFPFPRAKARIEFLSRDAQGEFLLKFSHSIDPDSYFIAPFTPHYRTVDILVNGDPANKVDIVLLGDGYTAEEFDKFIAGCRFFAEALTAYSPFREMASSFNFRAVWSPSAESGAAIPAEKKFPQTSLGASFYTFDSERYLMVENFQHVRDLAAHAPYDYIYILSNTEKYGGGGIYNFYGISAAAHPSLAAAIYVHEFAHLFMGLGDEYAYDNSYSDMYPASVEPWEENLTTLTRFDRKKIWNSLLAPDTPRPTPTEDRYRQTVGLYEGGGYVAAGVYRPWINCLMRELKGTTFCPVCSAALSNYIRWICR